MTEVYGVVVPATMDRPKRIAKQLQQIYITPKLSICQATTAHMLFHKDWHALEQAVKAGMVGAVHDEALSSAELQARRERQFELLCSELGGVDPSGDHSAPPSPGASNPVEYIFAMNMLTDARERSAHRRFSVLLARDTIDELRPTSIAQSPRARCINLEPLATEEYLSELPARIAQWWSVNVPDQPEVGACWRKIIVDPNSPTSLLSTGTYWGLLCLHYAQTIDWPMGMGMCHLFAARYATVRLNADPTSRQLISLALVDDVPDNEGKAAWAEVCKRFYVTAQQFMDTLARDDFADLYRGRPDLFRKHAKAATRILSKPGGRQGTWKR